jgi:hypothetical protein
MSYLGKFRRTVIRSGVRPEQKIRFFLLRKYRVGGEDMSLYALENDIIRPLGEPRVHFALNCMAVSCPRLRGAQPDRLRQPLSERADSD